MFHNYFDSYIILFLLERDYVAVPTLQKSLRPWTHLPESGVSDSPRKRSQARNHQKVRKVIPRWWRIDHPLWRLIPSIFLSDLGFLQIHSQYLGNLRFGGTHREQNAPEGTDVSFVGDKEPAAIGFHEVLCKRYKYVYPKRPNDWKKWSSTSLQWGISYHLYSFTSTWNYLRTKEFMVTDKESRQKNYPRLSKETVFDSD